MIDKSVVFFVLLAVITTASAADRNIMLVQQLEPGQIISVILVEHAGHARVGVIGMARSTIDKSAETSTEEFARLWQLVNSQELAVYRLKSDHNGNMADPNYFTVAVGADGKVEFDLKIPVKRHNESAEAFASGMRRYIDELRSPEAPPDK